MKLSIDEVLKSTFCATHTSHKILAVGVLLSLAMLSCAEVMGERGGTPPSRPPQTPPPSPPPTIIRTPPPSPPVFVPPPNTSSTVTPLVPTDITSPGLGEMPLTGTSGGEAARAGLFSLKPNEMPKERSDGNGEGIFVLSQEQSDFGRPRSTVVDLKSGTVFVSVRKPTTMAYVDTPLGVVALAPDSAIIVGFNDGVLRVMNLTGAGKRVKLSLDRGVFAGDKHVNVGVTPGYEIVAGTNKLERPQLRPNDKIARRHSSLLGRDNVAVNEFSLDSALESSALIATLKQKDAAAKEQRVLGDMSKMAAVVNQMRGAVGFVAETPSP